MNNKEFTSKLADRLHIPLTEVNELMSFLIKDMTEQWMDGNSVNIQGFGSFEVKKKMERISVNPTTKLRLLVPPKLVLNFKPSSIVKEKIK